MDDAKRRNVAMLSRSGRCARDKLDGANGDEVGFGSMIFAAGEDEAAEEYFTGDNSASANRKLTEEKGENGPAALK